MNPSLDASIEYHVAYYREAQEYVSRRSIEADLRKDPSYPAYLREAGIDPTHPNAARTFKRVVWPIIRRHLNPDAGWWARRYGTDAEFFHETFGTPEDFRDCVNLRIRDREKDVAKLERVYALTEQRCGQLGWSFDPQFDDDGDLVAVEVWKAAA